jgi:hypothetical protein
VHYKEFKLQFSTKKTSAVVRNCLSVHAPPKGDYTVFWDETPAAHLSKVLGERIYFNRKGTNYCNFKIPKRQHLSPQNTAKPILATSLYVSITIQCLDKMVIL